MAKKLFLLIVAATFAAAAASAQVPLSFGVTSSVISDFGGGVTGSVTDANGTNEQFLGNSVYQHHLYIGRANGIFFDAHFIQFSMSYFTSTSFGRSRAGNIPDTAQSNYGGGSVSPSGLEFTLLGKFPVELSPRVTVFPLLGVAYRLVLTGSPQNPPGAPSDWENARDINRNPTDLSSLWFRLGGGLDVSITDSIFVRGNITYGVRLPNSWENSVIDTGDIVNEPWATAAGANNWTVNYGNTRLGHGLDAAIGLGFRLR